MAIVLWIGKAGSLSSSTPSTLMGLPLRGRGVSTDRWTFYTLLTGPEAPEALHAEFKAGFSAFCLLSHPPFEAVLMSKDVKSLPGEGLGWGKEGEAGRRAWPSCPLSEFVLPWCRCC